MLRCATLAIRGVETTRPRREDYPGAWHHVMNRGAHRTDIFNDDLDRQAFIDELIGACDAFSVETHAYCLLGNHYHLLLHSRDGRPPPSCTRSARKGAICETGDPCAPRQGKSRADSRCRRTRPRGGCRPQRLLRGPPNDPSSTACRTAAPRWPADPAIAPSRGRDGAARAAQRIPPQAVPTTPSFSSRAISASPKPCCASTLRVSDPGGPGSRPISGTVREKRGAGAGC